MALTLNGSTGLSGIVGSAGTPALQGTDTNTGYFFGTDTLGLSTGGTQRLQIDSSGNVGIASTPTARLDVRRSDADGKIAEFHQNSGYGIDIGSSTSDAYIASGYNQKFNFKTDAAGGAGQEIRLTIDQNGHTLIGTTTWSFPKILNIQSTSGDILSLSSGATTSGAADTGPNIEFKIHNGSALVGMGELHVLKENANAGDNASYMQFKTRSTGGSTAEKLRIDSTGHIYIKGQNHEIRWYRDDEARYGAVTYDGSNFNIKNPVNDHTRVCKSDGTELVKFHNTGNLLIADGDLVISTSGHGIDFSAVSDGSRSVSDNTLSDYEEGTWTPTVGFGGGSATVANSVCTYTKVGRLVHIAGRFTLTSYSATSGDFRIESLPFTINDETADGNNSGIMVFIEDGKTEIQNSIASLVMEGQTYIIFRRSGTTGAGNDVGAYIDADTKFLFGGTYIA